MPDQTDTEEAPESPPTPDLNQQARDAADNDWRIHPLTPS